MTEPTASEVIVKAMELMADKNAEAGRNRFACLAVTHAYATLAETSYLDANYSEIVIGLRERIEEYIDGQGTVEVYLRARGKLSYFAELNAEEVKAFRRKMLEDILAEQEASV